MVKLTKKSFSTKDVLIGGLDLGKNNHYGYAKSVEGKVLKSFKFSNNLSGAELLLKKLESKRQEEGLKRICVGVESTGSYGEAITDWLIGKGVEVVGVNPKHVKRLKEVIDNSPGKTDKKDPKVITMVVELGRYMEMIRPKGVAAELRSMSQHRDRLKEDENRILNRIESQVVRIFPEFVKEMNGVSGKTALYLLRHHLEPKSIIALGKSVLTKLMKKVSCGQLGEQRSCALYQSAKQSIGIKDGLGGIRLGISDLIAQLELIQSQIDTVEVGLETLLGEHEESSYMQSVPGLGLITVSGIIGETGGFSNYKNVKKLEKLAGLNLFEISSGNHKGQKHISKRGRSGFRKLLYLAALSMIKKNGIYKVTYDKHLAKGMKKPQAIIAIAKKLLRCIFSLVKNKEYFNIEKVLN